jgi:MarR family transcriptional regulator, organic hydroperoxide resistance regulator
MGGMDRSSSPAQHRPRPRAAGSVALKASRQTASRGRFIDGYLAYLLARASHQVSREFHRELKPYGLTVLEWRVLATLEGSDGCSLGEVAEAVLFKQPTITKLIDRMERDGWVKRLPATGDRRRIRIVMTERGHTVVGELLAKAKQHEATCLGSYAPDEIENLKRILRDLLRRSARSARP